MEPIKQTLELKHTFTESEKAGLGDELSTMRIEIQQITGEVSTLNAKKKVLYDDLLKKARLFKTGFEMRDIDCEIQLNTPEDGKKTITRLDIEDLPEGFADDDLIWIENMSDNDYSFFPNPPEAEPKYGQFGLDQLDIDLAAESVIVEHSDDLLILDLSEGEATEIWPDLEGRLILKFDDEDLLKEFQSIFYHKRTTGIERTGMIIIVDAIPPDQTEMTLEENESVE